MRNTLLPLLALLAAAPAAAQHHAHGDDHAAHHQAEAGKLPEGWSARTDRGQPLDEVVFMAMGDGFHATTGPATVFFNPAWSRAGDFRVASRFTQMRAPEHPESYGILIGGSDLDGPGQTYTYFLVRGTGEYFIATRRGDERVKVVDWTPHAAVQKQDAAGRQVNVLAAEARGDQVVFSVNGTEVARRPRAELPVDGVHGYRINHRLDVMVEPVER